ncbi:MAG: hypothetical protein HUU38_09050 [Anaerolineales bacterium]|nr:hypothetical protein [Anaerolineales bacterium]
MPLNTNAHEGWLLEVYADAEGVVGWFLLDNGARVRLRQAFPITFYAAGPEHRLAQLCEFLQATRPAPTLDRAYKPDLFAGNLPVLAVCLPGPASLPRLVQRVARRFPDLTYFDVDIPLSVRFAHATGVFPFTKCRVGTYEGQLYYLEPLESRWEIQAELPPLRWMTLVPDTDPFYQPPRTLTIRTAHTSHMLSLHNGPVFLAQVDGLIRKYDPDVLISAFGDTWLLPYLLTLAEKHSQPFNPNRDETRLPRRQAAFSYHTYGRTEHRGEQVHLFGRFHIDHKNAAMYRQSDLLGVIEVSRLSALPLQEAARKSPGAGITAMQMLVALENGLLIPAQKSQVEAFKTPLELIRADRGGLVGQPVPGLHTHVAGLDFFSMYAQIMACFNLSPETVVRAGLHPQARVPDSGMEVLQNKAGLVPQTVAPILAKRKALKAQVAALDPRDCRLPALEALATALKWLLLVGFGYMGYKRFRWGRVEAHEAVTAMGRRALLQAKAVAEEKGFEVIYFNVDGLFVKKAGARHLRDFQTLLEAIEAKTGLTLALEAVFAWITFLPSRQNEALPVANRYFGVYPDAAGRPTLKVRGLESRRHDTPPFVAETQTALLDLLKTADPADLNARLPVLVEYLRAQLTALRTRQIPPEKLVCTTVLSREPTAYRVPSPGAKASQRLAAQGKRLRPGQKVRYLHTHPQPAVWGLSDQPTQLDLPRYETLLLRAASNVLHPLGVSEATLRVWMHYPPQWPPKVFDGSPGPLPLENWLYAQQEPP